MAKKVLMYNEKITLFDYCRANNIPYYRLVYRLKHNKKGYSLEELINLPKDEFIPRIKFKVNYKGNLYSLNKALKMFYEDNDLYLTTHSSYFTKGIKQNGNPQKLFDDYCERTLKNFKRV